MYVFQPVTETLKLGLERSEYLREGVVGISKTEGHKIN